MAFPGNFLRLVLTGRMYSTETWSMGLSIAGTFATGKPTQPDDLDPYITAAKAWFSRPQSSICTAATLTEVKCNEVGPDGKYLSATSSLFKPVLPVAAGGSSTLVPAQITTAITLETPATRGLGSKGRVYPPLSLGSLATDGMISAAAATAMADSFVTFVNAINALNNGTIVVASQGGVNGAPGVFRPVTSVKVGRVADTQRRRRGALADAPRAAATTPVVLAPGSGFGGDF